MVYLDRPNVLPPSRPSFSITQRPKSKVAIFFWKQRIWLESTFALTVYEPWEKVIVVTVFVIISIAMFVGLCKYLPRHLVVMQRRAVYYLWGGDEDSMYGVSEVLGSQR